MIAAAWAAGRSSHFPTRARSARTARRRSSSPGRRCRRRRRWASRSRTGPAVDDPVGADHARVADVDHVRVRHVEPDAEADEEHERDRQPRRAEQAQRLGPPAAAPTTACAPAGRRAADRASGVERPIRARRRRTSERRRSRAARAGRGAARVRSPRRRRFGRNGGRTAGTSGSTRTRRSRGRTPVVAARHRPRDLVAGPRLQHRAALGIDQDQRQLLRVGEPGDLPVPVDPAGRRR